MLAGFGFGGYRSFRETQRLGPLGKVNVVAGPNNSGKSNILRFLQRDFSAIASEDFSIVREPMDAMDTHIGSSGLPRLSVHVAVRVDESDDPALGSHLKDPTFARAYHQILESLQEDGLFWIELMATPTATNTKIEIDPRWIARPEVAELENRWFDVASRFQPNLSRSLPSYVEATARWMLKTLVSVPPVEIIPAVRELRPAGATTSRADLSGRGLIEQLFKLKNPILSEREQSLAAFKEIGEFVRDVTGVDDAQLDIPHDQQTILVTLGGKVLPLENLGTGIHEVVMLAAWCTIAKAKLVCIEEPEIHLHPLLQRKFVEYIQRFTSNQYLLTTHSASLIDYEKSTVFHLQSSSQGETSRPPNTVVARVISPSQHLEVCRDLGYSASDLLQTNSVIWVEGPSDRIYLNKWIRDRAPDLLEGLHYSIVFYGGRLLSHLSASDSEVDDFISLQRINRNVAILIDSDRKKQGAKINSTKARVRREIAEIGGLCWITKGREVENYVPFSTLAQAAGAVHPRFRSVEPDDEDYDSLTMIERAGNLRSFDKVKVARHIASIDAVDYRLDLSTRVAHLVDFIRSSN